MNTFFERFKPFWFIVGGLIPSLIGGTKYIKGSMFVTSFALAIALVKIFKGHRNPFGF